MRYSGTRISDAVTITTDRLGNKMFLYTQKTGLPVYTVLPDSVLRALESTPRVTTKNFFLERRVQARERRRPMGEAFQGVVCSSWRLKKRGQRDFTHRFRDTFAVELLLAGVPIERVSILLGHQSVRITEKHCNPWVRSRQEQLEADVARTWERDPVLNPKTQLATVKKIPGTKRVQIN
jgi:integrase